MWTDHVKKSSPLVSSMVSGVLYLITLGTTNDLRSAQQSASLPHCSLPVSSIRPPIYFLVLHVLDIRNIRLRLDGVVRVRSLGETLDRCYTYLVSVFVVRTARMLSPANTLKWC